MFVRVLVLVAVVSAAALGFQRALAFPLFGDQTSLPAGTELNEDAVDRPREVFHSHVIRGRKSYLVNLGDMAFNSPNILGGVARQAGISCGTCHVNGASNPKFYMPGMSTGPGTFDTSGPLFNPKANNHTLNPVRIPSLRGARDLAPYGNDGRSASLRDFIRDVIVVEFSGSEPSPAILDGLVTYVRDIDFLSNPRLDPGGRLANSASEAERRGAALFDRPFPHDPSLSCATCHVRSGAFLDHKQHDVGTGGFFKTPSLLNANFNAPYFHDGRFDSYDQVVAFFDRRFDLGLLDNEKNDLVAYLKAIGDGVQPYEADGASAQIGEINDFASVLDTAIMAHDNDVIALTVDTVSGELRDLAEHIPDRRDTTVSGGAKERNFARRTLKEMVVMLRQVGVDADAGKYADAAKGYSTFGRLMMSGMPEIVGRAQRWSLFNRAIHDTHYAALRQLMQSGKQPAQ
jgi:cytochrome c peroxidase